MAKKKGKEVRCSLQHAENPTPKDLKWLGRDGFTVFDSLHTLARDEKIMLEYWGRYKERSWWVERQKKLMREHTQKMSPKKGRK